MRPNHRKIFKQSLEANIRDKAFLNPNYISITEPDKKLSFDKVLIFKVLEIDIYFQIDNSDESFNTYDLGFKNMYRNFENFHYGSKSKGISLNDAKRHFIDWIKNEVNYYINDLIENDPIEELYNDNQNQINNIEYNYDEPLNKNEFEYLDNKIDILIQTVTQEFEDKDIEIENLEREVEYLKSRKEKELSKFDWNNILMGLAVNSAKEVVINPEKRKQYFDLFMNIFFQNQIDS